MDEVGSDGPDPTEGHWRPVMRPVVSAADAIMTLMEAYWMMGRYYTLANDVLDHSVGEIHVGVGLNHTLDIEDDPSRLTAVILFQMEARDAPVVHAQGCPRPGARPR